MNRELDEIVTQIETLPPGQRRQLLRQLKAMGLLEAEELLSDRNPLTIAPALQSRRAGPVKERRSRPGKPAAPPRPAGRPRPGPYRSPASGHNVVAARRPEDGAAAAMLPPTDQAPEEPIRIVFDGGSRGNPGQGYGSYALDWPGHPRQIVQLKFGDLVTNNEAEYDTLIAALEAVHKRLREQQIEPKSATLSIWGDSQLVCSQVRGDWRCKEPRLQLRLKKARAYLKEFGKATLNHHPREKSVEILGH